jgi:Zn-dependent protease
MTDLFSKFTKDSERVLMQARRIARGYKQQVITAEHLLLGLLNLTGSQAEQVLAELKANPAAIKTRLEATIKLEARRETTEPAIGYADRRQKLSVQSAHILSEAVAEAVEQQLDFVDTRLLILGMLRAENNAAGEFLAQHGVRLEAFRAAARLGEAPPVDVTQPATSERLLTRSKFPVSLSPMFLGLLLFTGLSGYLCYAGIGNSRRTLFLFVTGGWLISLALHEFGHALVAFWGGDSSVVDKGYLSLNPLKYTHPLLSIVLPMVFLLLGGIGLPGGAVYINRLAIRKNYMHSLVSAAGPLATLIFGVGLAIPFLFNLHRASLFEHYPFWAGLAFLISLQVFALLLNILPIPGLDGFGIVDPYLPPELLRIAAVIRPYGILLLFFVFLRIEAISRPFWEGVWKVLVFVNQDLGPLVGEGFHLFRFWTG